MSVQSCVTESLSFVVFLCVKKTPWDLIKMPWKLLENSLNFSFKSEWEPCLEAYALTTRPTMRSAGTGGWDGGGGKLRVLVRLSLLWPLSHHVVVTLWVRAAEHSACSVDDKEYYYCKVPCKRPLPCKRPPPTSGLKLCKGWCTK